jgi:hypothetical protein
MMQAGLARLHHFRKKESQYFHLIEKLEESHG